MKKHLTVSLVLTLALLFGVSGPLKAQDTYDLSLQYQDVRIKEVLASFTSQTGVSFSHESSLVEKKVSSVQVELRDATLEQCVEAALGGTGLVWKISGKTVALQEKTTTPSSQPKQPRTAVYSGTVVDVIIKQQPHQTGHSSVHFL